MLLENKKIAIATVAFNSPKLVAQLVGHAGAFCMDQSIVDGQKHCVDFILYDNASTDENETIKNYAEAINNSLMEYSLNMFSKNRINPLILMNKRYTASPIQGIDINNPSISHAFALNHIIEVYGNSYDYLLILDHDCFPYKEFSIEKMLVGAVIAGVAQNKSRLYPWAGCLAIDLRAIRLRNLLNEVDFMVNEELGLDTGGQLYKIIDHYGPDTCNFFSEKPHEDYNIIDDTFMHFINGSNWKNEQDHDMRIDRLFSTLEQLLIENNL